MENEAIIIDGEVKEGQWWGISVPTRGEDGIFTYKKVHQLFVVYDEGLAYRINGYGRWESEPFDINEVVAGVGLNG